MDEPTPREGLSLSMAILGVLFLLGPSVLVTYSVITEGFSALGVASREWWEYLFAWGLVILAFIKGIKCLYSISLHVTKVSPQDRYWKEHDAEERILKVVGGTIGVGLLGFGLLVSSDSSSSAEPAVTTGEIIIIGLLIAVLYNQRRK